jgi:hypothetical protein
MTAQLAALPTGSQADHAPAQVDALDGGRDESGGAQEGPNGEAATAQVPGPRGRLGTRGGLWRTGAQPAAPAGTPVTVRLPVQPLMKVRRSALITSACVVHMPCGNFS